MLENIFGGFTNQVPSAIDNLVFTLFIILGILIFLGVIGIIIFNMSFTKNVRIRRIVNGRVVVADKKARQIKDDKGVYWWLIKGIKDKEKKLMPSPTPQAIDIGSNGKEYVEVYYHDTAGYIFLKDMARVGEVPKDLYKNPPDEITLIEDLDLREKKLSEWKTNVLKDWKRDNGIVEAFTPFTTQQRVLTVNSVMDAEERRGKNIWKDLPQLFAISAFVIIVISLMIFWGDLARPVIDSKKISTEQLVLMQEISTTQQEIRQNIQTFKTNQDQIDSRVSALENGKGGVPN